MVHGWGSEAPGIKSIWCSIPRIGGSPGGTSCGKTSMYSCKRLATADGKEGGISSNENRTSLQKWHSME